MALPSSSVRYGQQHLLHCIARLFQYWWLSTKDMQLHCVCRGVTTCLELTHRYILTNRTCTVTSFGGLDQRHNLSHKNKHGHVILCFIEIMLKVIQGSSSPTYFRVVSLALGQSYDCPSTCEVTLKGMGKTKLHQNTIKHAYFLRCNV